MRARSNAADPRRAQPPVARERPAAAVESDKLAHLRQQLADAATLAHQLGVPRAQALKLFRETLDSPPNP